MKNIGRRIRRSMVILVVLVLFPSMGLATIIDGGVVGGKDLFMIEGATHEWVKISSTLDMSYSEGAAWGIDNGFRVANRLELMGLFHELVYDDNSYDLFTEFPIIGGINESSEFGAHWYSVGVYNTIEESGSLMPSTPGLARVDGVEGPDNDSWNIQISAFSAVDTSTYGTGVWLIRDSADWQVSDIETPVPEPATILLFGLGMLGLAGVNRRK